MVIKDISSFNKDKILNIFLSIKKKKNKFIESIDVAINLSLNMDNKINNNVRGCVLFPNILKKKYKIAVFTYKKYYDVAYKAGAYVVGSEDLIKKVKNGFINFNLVIVTVDFVKILSKIGHILGPKDLMPDLKLGTITNSLKESVESFNNGKVIYKSDKFGIIHSSIGDINFTIYQLFDNFLALLNSIKLNKFIDIKKISFSSTMGKSYIINL